MFQRVIYKRSWWDLLRGKVFAAGGFLRSSPLSGITYTENVGRYYTCFGIDPVCNDNLYYMVDGVLVNADYKCKLPAWISTLTK